MRIETQEDHLLITVTTQRDLDRRLHVADPAATRRFTEPTVALDAVAAFLEAFTTRPAGEQASGDTPVTRRP